MGSQPPSHAARLEMFCSLADEYASLAEAFDVDQKSFDFGAPPPPPRDRWHRIVRGMALRKFVLAPRDAVYGPTVVHSLAALLADEANPGVVINLRERFARIATWVKIVEGEGVSRSIPDLMTDLLYGNLLHGDYGKWLRARERRDFMDAHALWIYTADAERYVRRVRLVIEVASREGLLRESVPGAERGDGESPSTDSSQ